jgi:hypothetical protein
MEEERKHNMDNDDGKKKCNRYVVVHAVAQLVEALWYNT